MVEHLAPTNDRYRPMSGPQRVSRDTGQSTPFLDATAPVATDIHGRSAYGVVAWSGDRRAFLIGRVPVTRRHGLLTRRGWVLRKLQAIGPRLSRRMSPERRRLSHALLLSLLIHTLLLNLVFGGQGTGLPGFRFPWLDRRIEVPDLRLVLVPPQGTGAKSAVAPAAEPLPQAWVEQHVSGRPALTRPVPPVPASGRTAEAVVQEANPRAEAPLSTATATGVVPAESPLRADRPGDTALSPVPGPDVIALAPSDEANWDVPAAPATPAPVNAPASDTSNPVNAMPPLRDAGDAVPARIDQEAREGVVEPTKLDPSEQPGQRQAEQLEAARLEAARQEAARLEAERQETVRQEAAADSKRRHDKRRRDKRRRDKRRRDKRRRDKRRHDKRRRDKRRHDRRRRDKRRRDKRRRDKRRRDKRRRDKRRRDKRRRDKRRRDKRRRDKRRRDKRRRDKRQRDKRRRDKRQRDKRQRDKRRRDKRRHDKRRPADGRRYFGLLDDSWTRRPPGVKWRRPQRASYPCRAAHVEAGSSVAPTPTRNSSCTRKRGAEKSS